MDMKDNGCELNGTHVCRLLNMQTCAQCPMNGADGEDAESIKKAVEVYEQLLPQGGIAQFFETKECCFCREEAGRRGEKSGYAIFSMAHPEPAREKNSIIPGKKRRSPVGTLVPIQAGICKSCRRRLLSLEYLPTVMVLLFGTVSLLILANESVSTALSKAAGWLPVLIWIASIAAGYGIGRGLKALLKKKYSEIMYVDFLKHPVIREMSNCGWFVLPQDKEIRFVFSKTRTGYGLGTAPSSAYEGQGEQKTAENN